MTKTSARNAVFWLVTIAAGAMPAPAAGQHAPAGAAGAAEDAAAAAEAYAGAATGTARQPLAVVDHMPRWKLGSWLVGWHVSTAFGYRWESSPRGDDAPLFANMVMGSARRPLGPGWLELRGMASAEPAMGPRGYPLLLQTGETADGLRPLVDRQHPHELFMEISGSYRQEVEEGAWAYLYVAAVGEPALGPVAYPHRVSAGGDPLAPLGHHFLDATHIAHGVVTAGLFVDRRIQLELTWFNGREPDQDRWFPEAPDLNSVGGRITVMPGERWAIQASFADLSEPEQLHPGVDVYRTTLSATHHRPFDGGTWTATLAWGRNAHRQRGFTWNESAALLETALRIGATSAFARIERLRKSGLFPPADRRHHTPYTVGKLGSGLVREAVAVGRLRIGLGVSGAVHIVPGELEDAYGTYPFAATAFTRFRW